MGFFISTLVLGVTAIVLTFLNISGCSNLAASSALVVKAEDIVFPGEIKNVESSSRFAYLGGQVHANGQGKFIITSTTDAAIAAGSEWNASGLDKTSIGHEISVDRESEAGTGHLRAKVTIPELVVTQPVKVTGYLKIDALAAYSTGEYTFNTGQHEAESEEFSLFVYPLESRQITKRNATFASLTPFVIIAWILFLCMVIGWNDSRTRAKKSSVSSP